MPGKGVERKHSETAIFAALHRTLAHERFNSEAFGSDNLASFFLPFHFRFFTRFKKMRARIKSKFDKFLPGLNEYMIARTAFFDTVFKDALKEKTAQIVLLGAGYDSRPYRYAALNNGTRIFELDIETTQKRKLNCLEKAQIEIPANVVFTPINFNTQSLKSVLEGAGFEDHMKTVFIWEGVNYYLDPESVDATLAFVAHASKGETLIALDYAAALSEEDIAGCYGVKEFAKTMKTHHPSEIFKFTIQEESIGSFFDQRGLTLIRHLDNREIEKTFLTGEDTSPIGQITGLFRFVLAAPAGRPSDGPVE